jgi:hypothetical protein
MPRKAIIAATMATIVGAGVWALMMWGFGREYYYLAAGVGALVGLAAALFKARGMASGIVCAVLAIVAIAGGKVIGVQFALDGIILQAIEEEVTQSDYETFVQDAAEFDGVAEEGYAAFMVDFDYTDANSPEEVKPDELAGFMKYEVPNLKYLKEPPKFAEWRTWRRQKLDSQFRQTIKPWTILMAFNLDDAFFLLAGVIAAFILGRTGLDSIRQRKKN